MKLFIAVIYSTIAFLALATVATAGNPSLCAKDGWATAQSSSGQSFASMKDCAKAREVFQPTLTITPSHVTSRESFAIAGAGFHPNASVRIALAVTGQPEYLSFELPTDTAGGVTYGSLAFTSCGEAPPYDFTITLVDSSGVQASARLTLC